MVAGKGLNQVGGQFEPATLWSDDDVDGRGFDR
jgi:hypothetical protein